MISSKLVKINFYGQCGTKRKEGRGGSSDKEEGARRREEQRGERSNEKKRVTRRKPEGATRGMKYRKRNLKKEKKKTDYGSHGRETINFVVH